MRILRILLYSFCLLGAACSTNPPQYPTDLCRVFDEKEDWYQAAEKAKRRWDIPIALMMAFIYHESGFRADAQPPRTHILWILPGPRPSTAYGYPQALDTTWQNYQQATDNHGADRDDFADAIDFVGWYNHTSHEQTGIAKTDAYRLYLAYHEGQNGYLRGDHRSKPWLQQTARQIARRTASYQSQLASCETRLRERDSGWWPFS